MITTTRILPPPPPPDKPAVTLSNCNGNAISLLGAAKRTLRRFGYTRQQLADFQDEALSGDYTHVLATIGNHCDID